MSNSSTLDQSDRGTELIIADTSVLNYLVQLGIQEFLPGSFSTVIAPEAVRDELSHLATPSGVRAWIAHPPVWVEVAPVAVPLDLGLGHGESEAITLGIERRCPVILDDRAAREAAKRLHVPVLGTLSVMARLSRANALDFDAEVQRLLELGFRASPEVIAAARLRS